MGLTENLDLDAAKAKLLASDVVLSILNSRNIGYPDDSPTTIKRNTKSVINWLITDTYFPEFEKYIGWSKTTHESKLWPGVDQGKVLSNKLELLCKGLTQKTELDPGQKLMIFFLLSDCHCET